MSLADFFNSDKRTARSWDALDKKNGRPTTKDANARLMQAYKSRGLEMAEQALKAGACADLMMETGRHHGGYGYSLTIYNTPLLALAAQAGMKDFAEILLKHGADTEASGNHRNWTPLYYATDRGDTPLVRLLLDAGANPGPLHYGAPYGIAREKQYTDIADMIKNEPARREAQKQAAALEAIRARKEAEQQLIAQEVAAAQAAIALHNKAPSVTQTGQSITVMEPLKIKKPSR
jgi:Ankyrin repeats (3 copies)